MRDLLRFAAQVSGFAIAAQVYTADLTGEGFWFKLLVYPIGASAISLFVWGVTSETKEELSK